MGLRMGLWIGLSGDGSDSEPELAAILGQENTLPDAQAQSGSRSQRERDFLIQNSWMPAPSLLATRHRSLFQAASRAR